MTSPALRDRADVFHLDQPAQQKITIDRPARDYDHTHTYDLTSVTPASQARLQRLIRTTHWAHKQRTPNGWMGYHLPTPKAMPSNEDRLALLADARASIEQAIRLVREATRDTPKADRAEAYLVPSLQMCATDGHDFLGGLPASIDELMREFAR